MCRGSLHVTTMQIEIAGTVDDGTQHMEITLADLPISSIGLACIMLAAP